jgi:hypothetical protein
MDSQRKGYTMHVSAARSPHISAGERGYVITLYAFAQAARDGRGQGEKIDIIKCYLATWFPSPKATEV